MKDRMKSVKTLGLATVAFAAVAMCLGAGPASATVLCKSNKDTNTCGAANQIGKGSSIMGTLATGTELIVETSPGGTLVDTCTASTLKGSIASAGSATTTVTLPVAKADLTFPTCSVKTDSIAGGELEIHWIPGTDNGTVTIKEFEIGIVFLGENCVYGFPKNFTDLGDLKGGNPAKLAFTYKIEKKNMCLWGPLELRLNATYAFTEAGMGNTTMYVTSG